MPDRSRSAQDTIFRPAAGPTSLIGTAPTSTTPSVTLNPAFAQADGSAATTISAMVGAGSGSGAI